MKRRKIKPFRKLVRCVRAVSPVVSTVILIGTVVVLVTVAISFANSMLISRVAESEFNSMKQFMHTVGLQVDDVAWVIGRTQTIRYSSKYGFVEFVSNVIRYDILVNGQPFANFTVGMIVYNMPISKYSLGDGYYEAVYPSDASIVQKGTSAPVARTFVVERLVANTSSYIRVAVVPCLRIVNATIRTGGSVENYVKIYVPRLVAGEMPKRSLSITLTGTSLNILKRNNVNSVCINATFLRESEGFDNGFFRFKTTTETPTVPSNSVLQVYYSNVTVSIGAYS